jgi:ABC-type multidrug transport system ATPase subunit
LKLLELGCALATEPDILLLDEPSSGMGPEEAHQLGERLIDLRKAFGLTMLLIEHHVPLVLSVCDHVYVLNFGRLLAEGRPSVIQTHPEVVAAYLGGEAPDALEATEETDDDAALDAQLSHSDVPVDDAPTEVIPAKPRKAAAKKSTARRAPAKTAAPRKAKTAAEARAEKAATADGKEAKQ